MKYDASRIQHLNQGRLSLSTDGMLMPRPVLGDII